MVTKVQKWGNSQGLRLAKRVLEDAHISIGDDVDVTIRDGRLLLLRLSASAANGACKTWCHVFPKTMRLVKSTGAIRLAERFGKCGDMSRKKATLSP